MIIDLLIGVQNETNYDIWYLWLVIGTAFATLVIIASAIGFYKQELTVSQMNVMEAKELREYSLKKNIKGITGRESKKLLISKLIGHHLKTKKLVNSLSLLSIERTKWIANLLKIENIDKQKTKTEIIIKIVQQKQDFNIKINHKKLFHLSTPDMTTLKINKVYVLQTLTNDQLEKIVKTYNQGVKSKKKLKVYKSRFENILSIIWIRNHFRFKQTKKLLEYGKKNLTDSALDVFGMDNITKIDTVLEVALKIVAWHELRRKKNINLDKLK